MWYPRNSLFSTENFTSLNTGDFTYSNFAAQNNLGGYVALRNISVSSGVVIPPGHPWPSTDWLTRYDLSLPWFLNSGSVTTNSGTPLWNSAYQTTSLTGITSIDLVGVPIVMSNGYLVECGAMVASQTGTASYPGDTYGLAIQQATGTGALCDFVSFETYPYPGLRVNPGSSGELFIPASGLDESIFRFRMGRRGNLLQIIGQNGYSAISTGDINAGYLLSGDGYLPFSGISVGNFSKRIAGAVNDPTARIELDHLYYKYPIDDVAGDFIADTEYTTGSVSLFTGYLVTDSLAAAALLTGTWPHIELSRYTPEKPIRGYASVSYKLVGDNPGGATVIAAFKDDDSVIVVGIHTHTGTYYSTGGLYNVDLTNISSLESYTGSLRILISQVTETGLYRPPLAVEQITISVNADDHDGLVYLYPEYGSSDGEYPIVVAVDPYARGHVSSPTFLNPYIDTLVPFQNNDANPGSQGGTGFSVASLTSLTGTETTRGYFKDSPRSFSSYIEKTASQVDQVFSEFNSVPVIGTHYKVTNVGLLASTGYGYLFPSGSNTGTNFTGGATGTGGYWLNIYSGLSSYAPTAVDFFREPIVITDPTSNGDSYLVGQHIKTYAGKGFQTQVIDGTTFGTGDLVVEAVVSCQEGGLGIGVVADVGNNYGHIGAPDQYVIYPAERFNSPQRVKSLFPRPTGKFLVNFIGLSDEATTVYGDDYHDFTVADVSVGIQSGLGVDFVSADVTKFLTMFQSASSYGSGYTIDMWYKPEGFGYYSGDIHDIGFTNDPTYTALYGTLDYTTLVKTFSTSAPGAQHNQRAIAVDRAGFPHFVSTTDTPGDVTDLKSKVGLEINKWNHIAVTISTSDVVSIYINGELGSYTNDGGVARQWVSAGIANGMIVGSHICGHLEHLRFRSVYHDPAQVRVLDAFSGPPRFDSKNELSTGNMLMYYKFNKGTIEDYSNNELHCVAHETGSNRLNIERNTEGVIGDGIAFTNGIGHVSTEIVQSWGLTGLSVGGYLAALTDDSYHTQVYNQPSRTNLSIVSGKLLYTYTGNAGSMVFTGITNVVSPFAYRPFLISHSYRNDTITGTYITGYIGTGQGTGEIGQVVDFTGFITGQSYPYISSSLITIGHDINKTNAGGDLFLDQLFFYSGVFTGINQFDYRNEIQTPNQSIYINNIAVTGSRVNHIGVYEKEFYVPSRSSFTASGTTINLSVDTDVGPLDIAPAFTYIGARRLVANPATREKITEISDKICKTKSPFRIGATVPSDAVNLAYLTTTQVTPETCMTFIDGANSIEQNLVNAVRTYDLTTASGVLFDTYTGNSIIVTGQVNTDDFVLTSYVMSRPDVDFPAPVFYQHKLGGESLYPIVVGGSNTVSGDFTALRKSIALVDDQGVPIALEDFPWDLRISKYSEDGSVLPDNVYYVDLLSRDKYIQDKTIFAIYNAASPIQGYKVLRNYMEAVNPIPIYRKIRSTSVVTGETFSVMTYPQFGDLATGASLNNGIKFTVNMLSGAWAPFIHENYVSHDELIEE